MESVLFETPFLGDCLVDCITRDVRRDRAVEGCIEKSDGICVWKDRNAGFDYCKRCTVVSTQNLSMAKEELGTHVQRSKIREFLNMMISFIADDH